MTSLLPDVVLDAIRGRSLFSASESFGVVTLVVLVVLLMECQALRAANAPPARIMALSAVLAPLLTAVVLTIAIRIAELV